jgi:hypothetical protein
MKWRDLLAKWGLTKLEIKSPFVDATFEPTNAARQAAWELYVELLTRVAVQPLGTDEGDEAAALASLHSLFATTRQILKSAGPDSVRFAYVAITFLNQIVRPLTAKWHRKSLEGALATPEGKAEFRIDLGHIRKLVLGYISLLGELAGVEEEDQIRITGEEQ